MNLNTIHRLSIALTISCFLKVSLFFPQSSEKENKTIHVISAADISVSLDENAGARILTFALNGNSILKKEDSLIPNYGSSLWPAPQKRWGWPPPKSFYSVRYEVAQKENKITAISPIDTDSGYQIIKSLNFDKQNRLCLNYKIFNLENTHVKVGPWEVTVVPAKGITFFRPDDRNNTSLHPSTLQMKDTLGVRYLKLSPSSKIIKKKAFAYTKTGFLAHLTPNGLLFLKTFQDVPNHLIAPNQGEVEIFVNTAMGYMELENHGTYSLLKPNEAVEYKVRWQLKKLPENIPLDHISKALINYVENLNKTP